MQGELKESHITITSMMPGPTDTNFFDRAGMRDTKLGQSTKDDPAEVARHGFEALRDGKKKVLAGGLKSKGQAVAATVMPDSAKAEMHGSTAKPGSGES